jgi:hypothetical protein
MYGLTVWQQLLSCIHSMMGIMTRGKNTGTV